MSAKLTTFQRELLARVAEAQNGCSTLWASRGRVDTRGARQNLHSLARLGLVEDVSPYHHCRWRVTSAGRAALNSEPSR